jgi:arylsulfatase A-like enzyme
VPFSGPEATARWASLIDLYAALQQEVDTHVGSVLDALASRPDVAANTIVVVTSDHGEYAGSHGLRGKGASVYEEAIRVPLIVKDPRGRLTAAPDRPRLQLSSSVDIAPLLLTIACGSNSWRADTRYRDLAGRADLAAVLSNPDAPGRPFALHATDEVVTEYALQPYAAHAPRHVIGLITPRAKYATYSHWRPGTLEPLARGEHTELYDYSTRDGRLELANVAGRSPLEAKLRDTLERAVRDELHAPLAPRLRDTQQRAMTDCLRLAAAEGRISHATRLRQLASAVGGKLDAAV